MNIPTKLITQTRPVVLVSLDWIRCGDPPFGLGTASIASALRSSDINVQIVSDAVNRPGFCPDTFFERVVDSINTAGTNVLVGIGTYVWCEHEVQSLLKILGEQVDIVLGGPQISYATAAELEVLYPKANYFVRGYGEYAMIALANGTAKNGHLGLHIAQAKDLENRANYSLDQLPSPHLDGTSPIGSFVRWETQRGCPFRCSFCQHRQPGHRHRSEFATDRIHAESVAFQNSGTKRIAVLDPIFNTNPKRAIDLLGQMRETALSAELSLQCRFELTDHSFLDALEGLDARLEFGLQTIHKEESCEVKRQNSMKKVKPVIAELNTRDIPYEVSLIYGLPLQTLDSFRASVEWCVDHGVPRIRAWPLMLLRGTELHAQRDDWGFVESNDDRIPIVVESKTFSREDYAEMKRIADDL